MLRPQASSNHGRPGGLHETAFAYGSSYSLLSRAGKTLQIAANYSCDTTDALGKRLGFGLVALLAGCRLLCGTLQGLVPEDEYGEDFSGLDLTLPKIS
ncbi:unnamed protein product [Schistocephalus solidus]|uniref:DUF5683 domain-containing protein n=1 Tax=Schistocephalus solidus TaxID=70667 RepID=A0A183T264_SCHSO|nr:unnamed protein product [Schistocephalus solidus]